MELTIVYHLEGGNQTDYLDANGNVIREEDETDNEGSEGTTTYQYKLDANGNATQITRRTENRYGDFAYSYTTVTDYRYVDSFDLGRIWIDYYYPETF